MGDDVWCESECVYFAQAQRLLFACGDPCDFKV